MNNKERFKDKDGNPYTQDEVKTIIQSIVLKQWIEWQSKANDFIETNISLMNGENPDPPAEKMHEGRKLADGMEVLPDGQSLGDLMFEAQLERARAIKIFSDLFDVGQSRESAAVTKVWGDMNK